MKKIKTDNSTQKLLDMIRINDQKQVKNIDSNNHESSLPASLKTKHLTLGVLINNTNLTLVLVSNKNFTKKKELIKWHNSIVPENLDLYSEEFSIFLGGCLDNFLEGEKKIPIWCAIDSLNLKIRNMNIPDISKSKIANAAFWGLKKETDFNEENEVFNFEILGEVKIDEIKKKNILVFSAPRDEINSLRKTFKKAGYFLTGITAMPFAMQNFIKTGQIIVDDSYFAFVNISRQATEIYFFSQSGILLGRTIRTGSQSLIDEFDKPLEIDPIDYLSSMTTMDADEFSQIRDPASRIISKVARTGDYCSQHYTGHTPIQRYFIYGEVEQCKPFIQLVSTMIPASIDILEPIRDNLTDSIAVQIPQDAKQRNCVLSAFGIALSANHITPNFLFTFDDRQKIKKKRRILQTMSLAGIILLIMCFSIQFFLENTHKKELIELAEIKQQIENLGEIPKSFITEYITTAQADQFETKEYISDYIPLAVIHDICYFTSDNIYLTSMIYESKKEKKKQSDDDMENGKAEVQYKTFRKVYLNGQVSGHPYMLTSEFDKYILKLSESPVFSNIEVTSKQIKAINDKKRLFFKAALEVY